MYATLVAWDGPSPATEVVDMDEPPADALRRKKDRRCASRSTSSRTARRNACVSAGNTGALMAIARFVLKTLPGIDRPAIASQLPTRTGDTLVLDLGANVNCTPEQLLQFAAMGSALVTAVDGIERPTIGPAQHRRRGHQGQRRRQGRRPSSEGVDAQFLRQRRRRRHLQGHDRRRRLRRLRRQVMLKTSEGLAQMLYEFLRRNSRAIC